MWACKLVQHTPDEMLAVIWRLFGEIFGGFRQQDAEELEELARFLDHEVVLLGHSTGCQDCVHLLRHTRSRTGDHQGGAHTR